MRHLTKSQKQFLTQHTYTPSILPKLEEMNDYETLAQDAQRFSDDLRSHRSSHSIYRVMNYKQAQLDEEKFIKEWR